VDLGRREFGVQGVLVGEVACEDFPILAARTSRSPKESYQCEAICGWTQSTVTGLPAATPNQSLRTVVSDWETTGAVRLLARGRLNQDGHRIPAASSWPPNQGLMYTVERTGQLESREFTSEMNRRTSDSRSWIVAP
jgi:hypothetical protein